MNTKYYAWLAVLGAAILAGLYTAWRLFSEGHVIFNANDVIIWTLPIGSYVFFALTASGLGILSAMPLVFGVERYQPLARRMVMLAIASLLAAFVSIGLELGRLDHIYYLFLSPNLASPIQIMGLIYSLELVCLLVKFWRMLKGDLSGGLSKLAGLGSFVTALFGPLVLGSVFGITEARPTFFGPFLPILCLLLALVSGLAALLFYGSVVRLLKDEQDDAAEESLLREVGKKLGWSLFIALLFYLLWAAFRSATVLPDFATELSFTWSLFFLVPFGMMLISWLRSNPVGRLLAGASTLIIVFGLHMEVLLAGQVRPMGPKAEGLPVVLSYVPSVWEYLVVVFSLAVLLLAATLAERYLGLAPRAGWEKS